VHGCIHRISPIGWAVLQIAFGACFILSHVTYAEVCSAEAFKWKLEALRKVTADRDIEEAEILSLLKKIPPTDEFKPDEAIELLERLRWLPQVQHLLVQALPTEWLVFMAKRVWIETSGHPEDFKAAVLLRLQKFSDELVFQEDIEALISLVAFEHQAALRLSLLSEED
jgi:hypothetical protein